MTLLLHRLAEATQAAPDLSLGSAERDAFTLADLGCRAAPDDCQDYGPGLFPGDRREAAYRVLALEPAQRGLGRIRRGHRIVQELIELFLIGRRRPPASYRVDRGISGDREQPGTD